MKKILFISNNASRTGAPYVLLLFLRWLKKENKKIEIHILFLEGGDLLEDFKEVATVCYNYSDILIKKPFLNRVFSYARQKINKNNTRKDRYIKKIANQQYDIIYANTIATVSFATILKRQCSNQPKLIAHIHELNTTIKEYLPNFNEYVHQIDLFVSVSQLVIQNLNTEWDVNPLKNHLVYAFSGKEANKANNHKKVFEVGASGMVYWRKGDDLFIQVANYLKIRYPEIKIKFTWVGQIYNRQRNIVEADLEKANLKDTVFFIGEQSTPENYYKNFDVFLMTSREDPFPLVCIEVGKLGIPIICFEKATGTAEVLVDGGGFIVPYLDIVAMAEKVVLYYNDRALRNKDGDLNRVNFSKFTVDNMGEKILNCIESV
ncbi:glycosyltransferase family 4 protein [Flavobacterium sp. LB3P45]|uniref:Glycosyltransferase family 4 protein n=1 Tax=Flavobacterium fructosi TaxID=3230416 RepID=A0ABW6HJD6_9FLAO